MKTMIISMNSFFSGKGSLLICSIVLFGVLIGMPYLLPQQVWLDPVLMQLILSSVLLTVALGHLIWWLHGQFWRRMGLPSLHELISQFKELTLWQQYVCYACCLALEVLWAGLVFVAIC